MKKILFVLLALASVISSFAQSQFTGIVLYVADSATYRASTTIVNAHANGKADLYWNAQATTPHFDWWDGAAYQHGFGSGGGGGSGWPLTGSASLTGNVDITGDFDVSLGTSANHLNSLSVYTETNLLLHAQDQMAIDIHDDATADILTFDMTPKSLTIQAGDAAQTTLQMNDEDGGNGFYFKTTGNPIELEATSVVLDAATVSMNSGSALNFNAGDVTVTHSSNTLTVAGGDVVVPTETYDATGWNGDNSVPTKDAVRDKIETLGSVIGAQDLFLSASALWPRGTNGCSLLTPTEIATSLFTVQTLDFDQTTQEFAQIQVVLPRNWNNGTITATVYWTAASGSGGVVWGISGGAYSNDDALSTAFGTAQTVSDTFITANDVHVTSTSSAITLAGSPADADFLALQISRNPADGSDTLNADAKLLGVRITLTLDAATSE